MGNRTRDRVRPFRSSNEVIEGIDNYSSHVFHTSGLQYVVDFSLSDPLMEEHMRDVVGNRHGFNGVSHTKRVFHLENMKRNFVFLSSEEDQGVLGTLRICGLPYIPTVLNTAPGLSDSDLGDFGWSMYHAATNQIQEEIAFGNFVWEFSEVLELPAYVHEIAELVTGLRSAVRNIVRLAKSASGAFLGFQFGVQPLAEDLLTLSGLFPRLVARIEYLRKTAGKTFTSRQHRSIKVPENVDWLGGVDWGSLYGLTPLELSYKMAAPGIGRVSIPRGVVHELYGSVTVSNTLRGLDSFGNSLNAIGAALGLNNPARILWNKIPLSFLVEWFIKLDNIFFDLANNPVANPFPGELKVQDASYSVKSTWIEDVYQLQFEGLYGLHDLSYVRIGEAYCTNYRRSSGIPTGPYVSLGGGLSSLQKALLAALIQQRV